ncbi:PIN domain-containing protein [Bizionia sp. M204]|uniref:PIN domain-containing protein n=1 Tax=Bizionia sp. M204 TaxID=2675331 RepID=UPI0020555FA0|nr:PIN domain-containing protein [Bizionia sp. M204]UPS92090.1 DUF4935 domain-containing protein [Bizionia sp. M204]
MNIFIDTSILYPNPFWKGNYYSRILDVAINGRAKIYLSRVVIKELRHNFEKNLTKELFELKKTNSSLKNNLRYFKPFELPDKEKCLTDFDRFYEEMAKYNRITVLEYENDLLEPILERAIKREKPFSEKKTELKDALIWLTYSNYVNENKLENCFLLTKNCTDFCDLKKLKNNIFELHDELKKDCDKFQIFNSFQTFNQANSEYLDKPEKEFKEWIEQIDFSDKYVFDLLWENEGDSITDKIYNLTDRIDPDSLFEEGYLISMGGYLDIGDIEWYDCSDVEVEIVSDYAIVSGTLNVNAEIQGYSYNSVRDKGDEKFPFVGERNIEIKIFFNFTIEKEGTPENFEITDVITE